MNNSMFKMWLNPKKIEDQISYALIRYRSGEVIKHDVVTTDKDDCIEIDIKSDPNYSSNSAVEFELFSNKDTNIYKAMI